MVSRDDFEYAIENTRVIRAPERRIETFGSTVFRFHLVAEMMDNVNEVRVRDGRIHAEKPQIVTPKTMQQLLLEGFGAEAGEFAEALSRQLGNLAVLKYGFLIRKTDVTESIVHDPIDLVVERVRQQVENSSDPSGAVIRGVDDAWEVCLLKFTIDLIRNSAGGNLGDFLGRGVG